VEGKCGDGLEVLEEEERNRYSRRKKEREHFIITQR